MRTSKQTVKHAINKVIRTKGHFPNTQDISNEFMCSHEQAWKLMEALADDGYLEHKGDWFAFKTGAHDHIPEKKLPLDEKIDEEIKPSEDLVEKAIDMSKRDDLPKYSKFTAISQGLSDEQPNKHPAPQISSMALYIIKWSMLIVGSGSIAISIYYNTNFALEFLPPVLAVITGVIFVLFSVMAFEAMLLFMVDRLTGHRKKIIVGLALAWLIVASISIVSVVNGRYEKYMRNQHENSGQVNKAHVSKVSWKNLQYKKSSLQQSIDNKNKQIEMLYGLASGIKNIESKEKHEKSFRNIQYRIYLAENQAKKLYLDMDKLIAVESKELEKNPESINASRGKKNYTDFYEWSGAILGMSKDTVHFIISLLPAFFYDVISPISLALFLFLRKK